MFSKQSYLRLSVPDILLSALCALLVILPYIFVATVNLDLFWHLRIGEEIFHNGTISAIDTLSFINSSATPVYHEWLFELLLYTIYSQYGDLGLVIFRDVVLYLSIWLLLVLLLSRVRSSSIAILIAVASFSFFLVFFNLRPQSLTYLFLLLLIFIFDKVREGGRYILFLLPLLFLLWVNLHGGVLLGVLLAGIELIQLLISRRGRDRVILVVVGLSVLATLLFNPYGFHLFRYFLSELGASHHGISEWAPLDSAQLVDLIVLSILVFISCCSVGFKVRASHLLVFVLSLFIAAKHGRFIIVSVIFASLIIGQGLGRLLERGEKPFFIRRLWSGAIFITSLCAISSLPMIRDGLNAGLRLHGFEKLPLESSQFLRSTKFKGNIVAPFNWSSYLLWELRPDVKVAIDGRNLLVYPERYVEDYLKYWRDGTLDQLLILIPKDQIDLIVVANDDKIAVKIKEDLNWERIYEDPKAAIYRAIDKKQST